IGSNRAQRSARNGIVAGGHEKGQQRVRAVAIVADSRAAKQATGLVMSLACASAALGRQEGGSR
ncbi:MAG TPA: hypothetical protein VLN59_14055, partial [Burkholderiales bacterium]|nr:hypothetical protein [Burkholderiales bacterium]